MTKNIRDLILTPGQGDYQTWLDQSGWFLDAEVQRHFTASAAGARRRFDTGDRNHFDWRMSPHEIARWANPGPDGELATYGLTSPLTVGKLLDMTWPGGAELEPLPPEQNILEFARGDLVGHFLAGPLYFAPSYSVRDETQFRVACQWFKDNRYNCAVWMTEQTHWAEHVEGRDPAWTSPGPGGAPLIYTSPSGLRVFGWPLEEQLRRIRIMRADYGLHVVASLWEQTRVEHDFDHAIRNTPRVVEALDADVIAWLNSWEQNEVLDRAEERALNNAVGAAAVKSSGPHWARGIPDAAYWDGDRSHVFWHQYDRGGDLPAQAQESVRLCRESNCVSIGYEHSGMLPSRHRPVHTLKECRQRGREVVAEGEHLSLTG